LDKNTVASRQKPRIFYGYIIVIAAFVIMVVLHAAIYSYGVFFKPMSADFGWTRAVTSGAFSTSMFMTAVFFLLTGRLSDRFGPRIVGTVCGVLFGLGFLLTSQVNAVWQLYLFWGVMLGMGNSGGFVPLTSTVAKWFTRRRAVMTGIVVAGVGVGTMIGPPANSQLILAYGWRTSYIIVGSIILVLFILAAQFLRRDPKQMGQLPYGSEIRTNGPVAGLSSFSPREAIRTRQFWLIFITYICFGVGQMGVMLHMVPHATDLGITPIVAANIMTVIGGFSVAGRIILGSIADRTGNKRTLIIGLSLMTLSLIWLQFANELWMFYLFAAVFGFSYGGEVAILSPIVAELFGLGALGSILGMSTFAYAIGCAIGPIFAGIIFDMTGSYYSAFLVFMILIVTGVVLVSLIKPTRKEGLS